MLKQTIMLNIFLGLGYSDEPRLRNTKSIVFLQKQGKIVAITKNGVARDPTKIERGKL